MRLERKRKRAEKLRDAIKKTQAKKKETKADAENVDRWRNELGQIVEREIPKLEADNAAITGVPAPSRTLLNLDETTVLGGAEAVRGTDDDPDSLRGIRASLEERLRPGQLPAAWTNYDLDIADLLKAGATPPGSDNGELASILREQLREARRAFAVSQAQFAVFRGMLALVGKFARGGPLPATGLYLGHKDEWVVPDPKGPFGTQLAPIGRDAPEVTVVVNGGLGGLIDQLDVCVDGKLQRHKQEIDRRSRTFARAPGRVMTVEDARVVAEAFVRAVDRGDERKAWRLLERPYRLSLASAWLDDARRLNRVAFDDDAARRIADYEDEWRVAVRQIVALGFGSLWPTPPRTWGWLSNPRPIAADLEMVVYADVEATRAALAALPEESPAAVVASVNFYMRRTDGRWLIASVNKASGATA